MFSPDFYPTPDNVIDAMIDGLELSGKVVLEPHGGKGNLIERLQLVGAQVIASEINADLRKILQTKCTLIGDDFFKVESHQISHVNFIIMNPPFSTGVEHILHAYKIAPAGCKIVTLCNSSNIKNTYSKSREELKTLIETFGSNQDLGNCFDQSERKTNVEVSLIKLEKPGANYSQEFEGFFMDDEPEQDTGAGLMPYNVIRDLVNRYIESVKIFDNQLETAVQLSEMTNGFYGATRSEVIDILSRWKRDSNLELKF